MGHGIVGAETHFKVVVVSDSFRGVPLIKVSVYNLYVCPLFSLSSIPSSLILLPSFPLSSLKDKPFHSNSNINMVSYGNVHAGLAASSVHYMLNCMYTIRIVLQRHRVVMDTLKAEMEGPVHALSIQVWELFSYTSSNTI